MTRARSLLHALAHLARLNVADWGFFRDRDGHWWTGYRCEACGRWQGLHVATSREVGEIEWAIDAGHARRHDPERREFFIDEH